MDTMKLSIVSFVGESRKRIVSNGIKRQVLKHKKKQIVMKNMDS